MLVTVVLAYITYLELPDWEFSVLLRFRVSGLGFRSILHLICARPYPSRIAAPETLEFWGFRALRV